MMKKLLRTLTPALLMPAILLLASHSYAAAKIDIDDTKWLTVGAGARASYAAVEDAAGAADEWSSDFAFNNIRLYVNGQLNDFLKFEFNTECDDCPNGGDLRVLDAIAKLEYTPSFNIWLGRQLVASDRAELSGPFYQNTFEFNKTPFYPSDFGVDTAGRFGRDDGVNIWGALGSGGRLTYVVGAFDGLNGGANIDDNLLFAGRISYNFWDVEKNPGYYTSSTYYGNAGDIFTVGLAAQSQADGAGTAAQPADFSGFSADVLFEKVLDGGGVLTLEGEYKTFDVDLTPAALIDPECFCLFDGNAWTATGLFLAAGDTFGGRLQPYVRYTSNNPDNSSDRDEIEVGVNLILDGHNTRFSLMYQYGDIASKGRVWLPGVTGNDVSAIKLALQFQL